MEPVTSSPRPSVRRGRRLVAGAALVAATSGIGLGVAASPVGAQIHNPCATAQAAFRAAMREARFWIGAADTLAAAGNESMANLASNEASHFLGLADGALSEMSGAC